MEFPRNRLYENSKNVIISDKVTSIGYGAFSGCFGLTNITIPGSVTSISSFAFYNCYGLTSIICKAVTPPSLSSNSFSVSKSTPVYVPSESVEIYKTAQYWSEFTNIQAIDEQ